MSDFIPKPGAGASRGLGPKAQKLQALRDKAAAKAEGKQAGHGDGSGGAKALSGIKKTSFQRKAT
ncbi:hypothetical protein [Terriglobus sp.]|uniref:hypothetical protein n=1 Tax=Terriglobus sp. TaxID=1889013 RepID=UPI003B006AFD